MLLLPLLERINSGEKSKTFLLVDVMQMGILNGITAFALCHAVEILGALGAIRTPDPQIRSGRYPCPI
jgi:hypothetical protein